MDGEGERIELPERLADSFGRYGRRVDRGYAIGGTDREGMAPTANEPWDRGSA